MKRLFSLLAVLVLVFPAVCSAEGTVFTTDYFTLQLPDGWEVDQEDLESEEGELSLGFFSGPEDIDLAAGSYLVYYEELKDFSLWGAGEEELKEYADILLEELSDSSPELIGVVQADRIPLVLIAVHTVEGDYVYADTVTNGYSIQFEFYVTDLDGEKMYPITDEHLALIGNILATFKPVT